MSVSKEKNILLSEEDISILFSIGMAAPITLKLSNEEIVQKFNVVVSYCFEEAKKQNLIPENFY